MPDVKVNESVARRRRVRFQVTGLDGVTPDNAQGGQQPEVSTNDGAWTATGIGPLVLVGGGRYYAELTQAAVATLGDHLETRYPATAATAESVGDELDVVAYDPAGTLGASGVTNPGATGGMTLKTARDRIRYFARDAAGSKSVYSDDDVDFALQSVGEQFCRVTRCNRRADAVAIAGAAAAVDLSALGAGFHPERVVSALVTGSACALRRPTWPDLVRKQVECPAAGRPQEIAWESPAAAEVWPTPDADYTLRVQWWEPFTTWTIGVDDATAATIVLNCRPDYLLQILPFGPTALLQHNEPDMAYASESWQKYLAVELRLAGAGALGAKSITRRKACW